MHRTKKWWSCSMLGTAWTFKRSTQWDELLHTSADHIQHIPYTVPQATTNKCYLLGSLSSPTLIFITTTCQSRHSCTATVIFLLLRGQGLKQERADLQRKQSYSLALIFFLLKFYHLYLFIKVSKLLKKKTFSSNNCKEKQTHVSKPTWKLFFLSEQVYEWPYWIVSELMCGRCQKNDRTNVLLTKLTFFGQNMKIRLVLHNLSYK